MCHPAAPLSKAVRVATAISTAGTSELARKVPGPVGQTAALPGNLAYQAAGGSGAPPSLPWDKPSGTPAAPAVSDTGTGDAGPAPTPTPASPTESAAMLARKRLAALRMGLLSTIATSGQGVTAAPNIFAPTAFAAGTKTALGQ